MPWWYNERETKVYNRLIAALSESNWACIMIIPPDKGIQENVCIQKHGLNGLPVYRGVFTFYGGLIVFIKLLGILECLRIYIYIYIYI